jgi:hypothetical protein
VLFFGVKGVKELSLPAVAEKLRQMPQRQMFYFQELKELMELSLPAVAEKLRQMPLWV